MAANVAEIIGGIAILVSLIYVGYQIRQSNRIARVESLRATQSMAFMDRVDMVMIGNGFSDFDSLSHGDKWRFHTYFLNLWAHWQIVLDSKNLGLVPEGDLASWTHVMAAITTTKGVKQYLEQGGNRNLAPHTLEIVEDYIKKNSATITPYNEQFKWMAGAG
jgi:hypothetical protein